MLLYIHVPFCRRKCRYCAFHSLPLIGEGGTSPAPEALQTPHADTAITAGPTAASAALAGVAPVTTSAQAISGQDGHTSTKGHGVPPESPPGPTANAAGMSGGIAGIVDRAGGAMRSCTPAEALPAYVETLFSELALWGDRLGNAPVETIFFGGGTPSLLPPHVVAAILDRVHRTFSVAPGAEISLEANPESLSNRQQARALYNAGVNRLSLGVQALDDALLHLMGRPHRARDAIRAFNAARDAGFTNISLDFIWGLPGQRLRQWLDQLREVVRLRPEHLSCYGLTLEEGTPLTADVESGSITLPVEREQAAMFMQGAERLEEAGYLQYEISNFARMGFQCHHNLGYWEGRDYLGLGPSATSTIDGLRWTNPYDHGAWHESVRTGRIGADAERLDLTVRVLELVMLRLRTTRGLRVKAYRELTGRDFLRDHKPLVHLLHRNGLVRIRDGYLRLTRNGMLVSNSILERFFERSETLLTLESTEKTHETRMAGPISGDTP